MKVIRTSSVYNHHTFSTIVDAIVVNPVRRAASMGGGPPSNIFLVVGQGYFI